MTSISLAPSAPPLLRSNLFEIGKPIGCTSLFRGCAKSTPCLGRFVPSDKVPEFIAQEGRVYSLLKSAPHKHLPRLIACFDDVPVPAESLPAAFAGSAAARPTMGGSTSAVSTSHSMNPLSIDILGLATPAAPTAPTTPATTPSPPSTPSTAASASASASFIAATSLASIGNGHPKRGHMEADDGCVRGSIMVFPEYHSDLHTHIRTHGRLSEDVARVYFRQLMSGVAHCHQRQIVLGDIRLGKIMFTDKEQRDVVFADLSGARYVPTFIGQAIDCKGMSPAYVAPEVLSHHYLEHHTPMCLDVWAMGVVLFVMLAGQYPFSDLNIATLCQKILAGRYAFPDWVSPSARRLISRLLARDPAIRPTAREVLEDSWLRIPSAPITKRALCQDEDDEVEGTGGEPTVDQVVPGIASNNSNNAINRDAATSLNSTPASPPARRPRFE